MSIEHNGYLIKLNGFFMHEDVRGLIAIYNKYMRHNVADKAPSIICPLAQSSWTVHSCTLHNCCTFFCSIVSGHQVPEKPQQYLPAIVDQEGLAKHWCHRTCSFPPSALNVLFLNRHHRQELLLFHSIGTIAELWGRTSPASPFQDPHACGPPWAGTDIHLVMLLHPDSDGGEEVCQHHPACCLFLFCQQTAFSGRGVRNGSGAHLFSLLSQYSHPQSAAVLALSVN